MTAPSGSGPDIHALAAFAHELADAAGAVIRPYFRANLPVEDKADESPVTRADREAEAAMRALIEARYPDHGIYGEEHGQARLDAEYIWIIDPIDGTRSFICGIPLFGTLAALWRHGKPLIGVIDQPISGERWSATAGGGATLNGEPARTRRGVALDRAAMFTTAPEMMQGALAPRYGRLRDAVGMVRHGADCYAAGLLASGHIDLFVEAKLQPYDYAALVPIIEEAGGVATDWAGRPLGLSGDGTMLAAGSRELHDAAREMLAA